LSAAAFARALRNFDAVFDKFCCASYRGIANHLIEIRSGFAPPVIALR
jgi:hypothetical protein